MLTPDKEAEKRFIANSKNLAIILEFVNEFVHSCMTSAKVKKQIELAVEEMVVNIIQYAYDGKDGPLDIRLSQQDSKLLQIELIDWGQRFDPTRLAAKDLSVDKIEELEEGGLGIFLANQVMDNIQYQRLGTENHLLMRKDF
ncbi:MAG: ATP-binding protein [Rhabdochlamydiaceae bacterium]|nr:ATP-binding protein [Candidatus Amphrikana amoebophyrae]